MILDYILKFHVQECLEILSEADLLGYFSLKIDFMNLFETHPDIGDKVLCSPIESLPLCDKDVIKAQQYIIENEDYRTQVAKLTFHGVKNNVHARFFSLPVCPELHRTIVPKNIDLGCFLKVTGTIVRATQSKMLEYHRMYVCNKCKHETMVEADFDQRYVLKAPTKCTNKEKKCKCSSFTQVNLVSREHCKDYQEIKIQEQINKLGIGTIPGSMWVVLEDDLVDSCKPGDDIHICGTVRRRWRPHGLNRKSEVELVLQANWLEVCNAQQARLAAPDLDRCFADYWDTFKACPFKGRDGILASVCPQVYGLYFVKLALLLTIITSADHSDGEKRPDEDMDTSRVRGQCHLLLVGDPGTGKSQLLGAAAELAARAVRASGAASSAAGLTCAAIREDGEWHLEAGALVRADGGAACVDEAARLAAAGGAALHEAMEQQTVSVAKAGIVCKLSTRCSVVAACNPRGPWDPAAPLAANVALGAALLSRFDLIFILLDSKNKAWDELVSSYILFGGSEQKIKNQWSIEKLQMYISMVGSRRATLTPAANRVLQACYMSQRSDEARDATRTTVRLLDSLLRLSQAHCRLMHRSTILPCDAIVASALIENSMQGHTQQHSSALHSLFPTHPDFTYLCTAKNILAKLALHDIWKEELLHYAKLLNTDHKTLEHEIDSKNSEIFAKYDNVSDENIPLSATQITSSYFKDKKPKTVDKENKREENLSKNVVNKKLVATLKKHASLNKETKEPVNVKKAKRKRKEVIINTGQLNNKSKKCKKESNTEDVTSMLKAVPSVNDVFSDLNLDLNFEDDNIHDDIQKYGYEENKTRKIKTENVTIVDDSSTSPKDNKDNINKRVVTGNTATLNKLKMFQYKEKRDLSKFSDDNNKLKKNKEIKVEKNVKSEEKAIKTVQNSQISIFESSICDISIDDKIKSSPKNKDNFVKELGSRQDSANSETNKKSVTSSQISIFESSDCDIDLDL